MISFVSAHAAGRRRFMKSFRFLFDKLHFIVNIDMLIFCYSSWFVTAKYAVLFSLLEKYLVETMFFCILGTSILEAVKWLCLISSTQAEESNFGSIFIVCFIAFDYLSVFILSFCGLCELFANFSFYACMNFHLAFPNRTAFESF